MKRLIIMRHAKSSWDNASLTDHQRPLSSRGREAAPRIAKRLCELSFVPELMLISDSERTLETARCMQPEFANAIPTEHFKQLYLGRFGDMQTVISQVPDALNCVLLLAHNPGCEQAIEWLTGKNHVVVKTADAAILERSEGTWQAAITKPTTWQLLEFIRARDLEG